MTERNLHTSIVLPEDEREGEQCAKLLLQTLNQHPGVRAAQIDFQRRELELRYEPDRIAPEVVAGVAADLGIRLGSHMDHCALVVDGMDCRNCAPQLEAELAAIPGVHRVTANPAAHVVGVHYESPAALASVKTRIAEMGYQVASEAEQAKPGFWTRNIGLIYAGLTLAFLLLGLLFEKWASIPAAPWMHLVFFGLAYVIGGYEAAQEALRDLRHGKLNVDLLMLLAALGAAALGQWAEGAILLFLFSLSGALEEFALDRTHSAIEALTKLRPTEATVRRGHIEERVPVEAVKPGDIVVVRPGEQVAVDGVVVSGETSINQAAITGESMPVFKKVGDEVFAGTINQDGAIDVRATRPAQDSTLARIIELVAEAQSERAPTQRLIDRFAHPYAVAVLSTVALIIVVGTWVLGFPFDDVFYRAMTLLVVASPCALVISTPASILSAIAAGARNGILFKGGAHLENAATVDTIAFDKTGTLTYGEPEVTDVLVFNGYSEDALLRLTASAERRSEHPIARAIVREAERRNLTLSEPEKFVAVPGQGVKAVVEGRELIIGNETIHRNHNGRSAETIPNEVRALQAQGKTVVMVYNQGHLVGAVAVADRLRENAADTVAALRRLGVKHIVMLTGDHRQVAEEIARSVNIDQVHAELLPADKVAVIKRYQEQGARVAMVGDGVNDAPALALATVGIAMGAAGTDVALETADVVLMADDLCKLPLAMRLARRSRRIIAQNMAFALGVMALLVIATFTIGISLPLGVIGHEGSTLVVVFNGLRLLKTK
ncbi:MAG: cadmium-translocating P-type ATPase [Chloroflexi bacterium]|nr:cadmium-translocating P-type ATPase [Chloroflexota bacterium]